MAAHTNLFNMAASHGSNNASSSSTAAGQASAAAQSAPSSSLTSSQVESARRRFRNRVNQGKVHFKVNPALIAVSPSLQAQNQRPAGAKGSFLAKWSERSFGRFEHEEELEEDSDAFISKSGFQAKPATSLLSAAPQDEAGPSSSHHASSASRIAVPNSSRSSSPFSRGDTFATRGRPRQRKSLPHLHLSPRERPQHDALAAAVEKNSSLSSGSALGDGEDVPRPILSRLPPLVEYSSWSQLRREEAGMYADAPTEDMGESLDALERAAAAEEYGTIASQPQGYLQAASRPEVLYSRARLPKLDEASRQVWESLHAFKPLTQDYARGYLELNESSQEQEQEEAGVSAPHPIAPGATADQCPAFSSSTSTVATATLEHLKRSFNWSSLPPLSKETEGEWYGVAFRSIRRAGSDSTSLYAADRLAHEEAVGSGGLLFYWYGVPSSETGENLATCVWTSRADAREASRLPMHGLAARESRRVYDVYSLFRYRVVKRRGETGLRLEQWMEEEEEEQRVI